MLAKCKVYFISIMMLLILNSCVMLETHIDVDSSDYIVFPIAVESKFLSGTDYVLDKYTLTYKGNAEYKGTSGKIETRNYIFYENKREICKLEVIETTKNGFLLFTSYEKHIKFIYPNGINHEYKINTLNDSHPEENYVVFQNDSEGTIFVNQYYGARNKDNKEYMGDYPMGYDIFVNNERYGILAFDPSALYLKVNNKIDRKMALYTLAVLISKRY